METTDTHAYMNHKSQKVIDLVNLVSHSRH